VKLCRHFGSPSLRFHTGSYLNTVTGSMFRTFRIEI
jgi:hypothetical protein